MGDGGGEDFSDSGPEDPAASDEQGDAVDIVFGKEGTQSLSEASVGRRRTDFRPWHHPVKQIVRERQWAELTRRLLTQDRDAAGQAVLRYFTLPGPDLLDVRVISDAVADLSTLIEYLGFDINAEENSGEQPGAPVTAESALHQAGRVTKGSRIFKDRLEDIANDKSQAANNLAMQTFFDVINIDGCNHLGYSPPDRNGSTFDAIEALLRHQLTCKKPWLLFVTTRADPQHLSGIGIKLQTPINNNLIYHGPKFGPALADCIEGDLSNIAADLTKAWGQAGMRFLKVFTLGYGKHLIHWFLSQIQLPAEVELASAYGYRVHGNAPDMLSLAFRITPLPIRALPPGTGGVGAVPTLVMEPGHATALAKRAAKLWDLDSALATDEVVRKASVAGTRKLLQSANYDLAEWVRWLKNHPSRPIVLEDEGAAPILRGGPDAGGGHV